MDQELDLDLEYLREKYADILACAERDRDWPVINIVSEVLEDLNG